jgi:hypothetical protein
MQYQTVLKDRKKDRNGGEETKRFFSIYERIEGFKKSGIKQLYFFEP